jgi:N-acetylglutamate synthase-like GNAT family acetyltransferase
MKRKINSFCGIIIGDTMIHKINYKLLDLTSLPSTNLKKFNRYQETNRVWYKDNDQFNIKADHFVEQWDDDKKMLVLRDLENCVKLGGIVVGAFLEGDLIGFANVEGELFGSKKEYRELTYIHVSNEYRNGGIGKKLFQLCCEKAKEMGTKKLYIAAHPSEETQHFYRKLGCTYAAELNQAIFNKEPLDIQLEFVL